MFLPLFTLYVSLSSSLPHGHVYVVSTLLSAGVQALVLLCIGLLLYYLMSAIGLPCTKDLNISIPARCLLGDKCAAGMVIRKEIDMRTQWTAISLGFILSVSAARLIHLQLSRLVEQVSGSVVRRRGHNPQSGPAGCGGSDRWSRVT